MCGCRSELVGCVWACYPDKTPTQPCHAQAHTHTCVHRYRHKLRAIKEAFKESTERDIGALRGALEQYKVHVERLDCQKQLLLKQVGLGVCACAMTHQHTPQRKRKHVPTIHAFATKSQTITTSKQLQHTPLNNAQVLHLEVKLEERQKAYDDMAMQLLAAKKALAEQQPCGGEGPPGAPPAPPLAVPALSSPMPSPMRGGEVQSSTVHADWASAPSVEVCTITFLYVAGRVCVSCAQGYLQLLCLCVPCTLPTSPQTNNGCNTISPSCQQPCRFHRHHTTPPSHRHCCSRSSACGMPFTSPSSTDPAFTWHFVVVSCFILKQNTGG